MLISDNKKFIFIHIPKTAGSSIRSALKPYANPKSKSNVLRLLKNFNLPRDYRKFHFKLHSKLQDAQNKMPSEVFTSYKKIAFVRNPWDRVVSNFAFKVHGTDRIERNRNDSFENFIHTEFELKKSSQFDYICDLDGRLDCDFIGRFESLAEDYMTMQDLLGIELPPLPMLNASKRRNGYQDHYTQETKELVAKYYQKDIETFGYTF